MDDNREIWHDQDAFWELVEPMLLSIRSYSAFELSSLLADGGFSDIRVFGSLDGIEYNQEAQRLVVVARK